MYTVFYLFEFFSLSLFIISKVEREMSKRELLSPGLLGSVVARNVESRTVKEVGPRERGDQHVGFTIPTSNYHGEREEEGDYIEVGDEDAVREGYEDENLEASSRDRDLQDMEGDYGKAGPYSHTHPSSHPAFGTPSLSPDGSLSLTNNPALNGMLVESFNGILRMYRGQGDDSDEGVDIGKSLIKSALPT